MIQKKLGRSSRPAFFTYGDSLHTATAIVKKVGPFYRRYTVDDSCVRAVGEKGKDYDLLLITDHDHDTISEDGVTIKVVTAREWLLG